MKTANESKRARLLEAIAAGRTCEQILAADCTLTYHDIFHAVAEPPTSFWRKKLANHGKQDGLAGDKTVPTFAKYRID